MGGVLFGASAFLRRLGSYRDTSSRVAASFDCVTPTERACALSDGYPLEITEVRDTGRVRVRLLGELDLATAPLLAETLRRLRAGRESVLLDLDELAFMDMSGLRVLLDAADASQDGWAFAVTPGSTQVRRLIALVPLADQLPRDRSVR